MTTFSAALTYTKRTSFPISPINSPPVILKLEYEDGSYDEERIPAEIWRMQNELLEKTVSKVLVTNKSVRKVVLDPNLETADTDISNNIWSK